MITRIYIRKHALLITLGLRTTPDDLCNIVICLPFSLSYRCLPPGCRLSESPHNVYQRQRQRRGFISSQKRRTPAAGGEFQQNARVGYPPLITQQPDEWDREPPPSPT